MVNKARKTRAQTHRHKKWWVSKFSGTRKIAISFGKKVEICFVFCVFSSDCAWKILFKERTSYWSVILSSVPKRKHYLISNCDSLWIDFLCEFADVRAELLNLLKTILSSLGSFIRSTILWKELKLHAILTTNRSSTPLISEIAPITHSDSLWRFSSGQRFWCAPKVNSSCKRLKCRAIKLHSKLSRSLSLLFCSWSLCGPQFCQEYRLMVVKSHKLILFIALRSISFAITGWNRPVKRNPKIGPTCSHQSVWDTAQRSIVHKKCTAIVKSLSPPLSLSC